jgi:hypothetical protein
MRASIGLLLCMGCGVFGGPSIEGKWVGDCETEDQNDQNYDYEITMDFEKVDKDRAEGEGDFDSSVPTTGGGEYDISAEANELDATLNDDEWDINGEFELDQGGQTVDMEMTADIDGDDMTAEVAFDWGNIDETGDCTLNRE